MPRSIRPRLAHADDYQTLDRLVYRATGVGIGVLTLGVGRAFIAAVASHQWGAALSLAVLIVGLGALTAHCFGRTRRLSDMEP